MPFYPIANTGEILVGTEWDERAADAELIDGADYDHPHPADRPLAVAISTAEDEGILVVDIPVRFLEPHARDLVTALEGEGIRNERYPHDSVDPDGEAGPGIRIDITNTPASRAVVVNWIETHQFDVAPTVREGLLNPKPEGGFAP